MKAKLRHLGDMEVLVETHNTRSLEDLTPAYKAIIKAYEDVLRSLFHIHKDNRIIYAPYGDFQPIKKGAKNPTCGVEIQIHNCCGVGEDDLRMLNKISKFDSGEYPSTEVKIEACDNPKHQKFSKKLGETFTCTQITIDVDFNDWENV